ncbi:DUF3179 domain-containing protein [Gracilimonas sp.]|uniref:DUF3179 domain-containing protein n=1 Tax=Gracilimonas sp. TaxID=1974203 RepID=UPI003D0DE7B1
MKAPVLFTFGNAGKVLLLVLSCAVLSCDQTTVSSDEDSRSGFQTESEWLVAEHEIIDGGPGKDGIPPIEEPKFSDASEVTFIPDNRRVIGLIKDGEPTAYPYQILDWHEVVNDESQVTITFCPLTATGIAWSPKEGPDFGTSGLIYRNNLIAYDRKTGSLWSQMRLRAIHGEHLGATVDPLNVLDTTWETWKSMFPESRVLNTNTGYSRDYKKYAYGSTYEDMDGVILFPTVNRTDTRLDAKDRVHGIFTEDSLDQDSNVRVYEYSAFGEDITTIHDEFEGEKFVIVGSTKLSFVIAYQAELNGEVLEFEPVQGELPVVMMDQSGTKWNVFGEAVSGPNAGGRLFPAKSYSGYWFAFRDMFNLPEIYGFEN